MSAQFLKESAFSRVKKLGRPSKFGQRGSPGYSAQEILAEAVRVQGFCNHVPAPKPPVTLAGLPAEELLEWYQTMVVPAAETVMVATKAGSRRQRSDTPIIGVAVVSYPGPADEEDSRYVVWRRLAVDMAAQRYGAKLVSILEHTDESMGHLHIIFSNAGRSVKPLLSGHRESVFAKRIGMSRKDQGVEYIKGCKEFQDEYYERVSKPIGLTRLSESPRPRRARSAHLIQKEKELREREEHLNNWEKKNRENEATLRSTIGAVIEKVRKANAAQVLAEKVIAILADLVPDEADRDALLRRLGNASAPRMN